MNPRLSSTLLPSCRDDFIRSFLRNQVHKTTAISSVKSDDIRMDVWISNIRDHWDNQRAQKCTAEGEPNRVITAKDRKTNNECAHGAGSILNDSCTYILAFISRASLRSGRRTSSHLAPISISFCMWASIELVSRSRLPVGSARRSNIRFRSLYLHSPPRFPLIIRNHT